MQLLSALLPSVHLFIRMYELTLGGRPFDLKDFRLVDDVLQVCAKLRIRIQVS